MIGLCRLCLVLALSPQVYTSCYYPDGTYIARDQPCVDSGNQESFCCGPGITCLSDKVCYNPNGSGNRYVRGSCTDQSFGSSACPDFCLSAYVCFVCILATDRVLAIAPSNRAGVMFQCGGSTDSYCCSPDSSPCSCELDNITLAASSGDVSLIAIIGSAASTTAPETQSVPSPATSSM